MRKLYNFDETIERRGTNCIKFDKNEAIFGTEDVMPMWVADMDFRTPDFIIEAIKKRLEHEILGYTFRGDSYFDSIQNWMKKRHHWDVEKDWITFSPGVVAGLTMAIEALSQPGDKVIVQPPVYYPFFDSVKGTHRNLVENPFKTVNGRLTFDFDDLKAKIDEKTKLLLLCNPQNPGGMVWTREELTELSKICMENGIIIISDEIHSDLVFKGMKHLPLPTISEEIKQNTVVCMAPSKTFNTAGLTTSVIIIPNKRLKAKFERQLHTPHLHMGNIFGTIALEAAYTQGEEWLEQLLEYLEGNFHLIEDYISQKIPQLNVMQAEATYLAWIDFSALGLKDKELEDFVIKKAGLGLSAGKVFGTGGKGFMRMNFGCPRSYLEKALKKMETAIKELV